MKEIIEGIKVLATKELISANNKFPMFQSTHEGYAVLLEEVEEVNLELLRVKRKMSRVWYRTKRNKSTVADIEEMRDIAINMAAESIQVIAMCQKFIDSKVIE